MKKLVIGDELIKTSINGSCDWCNERDKKMFVAAYPLELSVPKYKYLGYSYIIDDYTFGGIFFKKKIVRGSIKKKFIYEKAYDKKTIRESPAICKDCVKQLAKQK